MGMGTGTGMAFFRNWQENVKSGNVGMGMRMGMSARNWLSSGTGKKK